jgi:hypothetical protein
MWKITILRKLSYHSDYRIIGVSRMIEGLLFLRRECRQHITVIAFIEIYPGRRVSLRLSYATFSCDTRQLNPRPSSGFGQEAWVHRLAVPQ